MQPTASIIFRRLDDLFDRAIDSAITFNRHTAARGSLRPNWISELLKIPFNRVLSIALREIGKMLRG